MKKKLLSAVLIAAMTAGMLAGCGAAGGETGADTTQPQEQEQEAPAEEAAVEAAETADEGKILNIYCWNDEFKRRIQDHYPGYTADASDATKGTIGDVTVVWNITPNDDNAYQNNLDETLLK